MPVVSVDVFSRGIPFRALLVVFCCLAALGCSDTCACGDPQPTGPLVPSTGDAANSVLPGVSSFTTTAAGDTTTELTSNSVSHAASNTGSSSTGDETRFTGSPLETASDVSFTTDGLDGSDTGPATTMTATTNDGATHSDVTGSSLETSGDTTNGETLFPPGVTKPKILIIGDSISAGPGCYKKYLDARLKSGGITGYEFVGEYTDDCGGDVRHGAVSCTTTSDYLKASFTLSASGCPTGERLGMAPLVEKYQPDLVLLQLGVNDVWGGGQNVQTILNNYETLIDQARSHRPNVVVAVAQIHKIKTVGGCTEPKTPDSTAQALVDAVPEWALRTSTATSPVFAVDLWTNSLVSESDDCVHPNDAGAQRMADNWYEGLKTILN